MTSTATLYERVEAHLLALKQDTDLALNASLLEECGTFLAPQLRNDRSQSDRLILQTSSVAFQLKRDPSTLLTFLKKLLKPYVFSDILALQPSLDLVAGLRLDAQPYNDLTLCILDKAADSPGDAAVVATMPQLIYGLVNLWLRTPNIGIADKAGQIIQKFLGIDIEDEEVPVHGVGNCLTGGQGLFWRRLFGDRDIYGLIFTICDRDDHSVEDLTAKTKSLAQARLMDFAPHVGKLDWAYLAGSHHEDIEAAHKLKPGDQGFLDFIALKMSDYETDVLIHISLIQFYAKLISLAKSPVHGSKSQSLIYLMENGVHDHVKRIWLSPDDCSTDPTDVSFLYGPSAHYMASWATNYPRAIMMSPDLGVILLRLRTTLNRSANQWAHGESPKHDLNVLVSLPRVALLPQTSLGTGYNSTPLLKVPCRNTQPDALDALAKIFIGPPKADGSLSLDDPHSFKAATEASSLDFSPEFHAASARALYIIYLHHYENFFTDILSHANILALPGRALSAINLLASIADANWEPLPEHTGTDADNDHDDETNYTPLPKNELQLRSILPNVARFPSKLAVTGIGMLLQSPAQEQIFPYLLRPPQTFSNLVGGRGDPESNAYKIAMAKWDLTKLVHSKMSEIAHTFQNAERLLFGALDDRIRDGPWGRAPGAGGQVASLEL